MPDRPQSADNLVPKIPEVRPLVLEAGSALTKELKESAFTDRIARLREKIVLSLGIVFPSVNLQENRTLLPHEFVIKVREVEANRSKVEGTHAGVWLESQLSETIKRYAVEFLGANEVSALVENLAVREPELVAAVYPAILNLQDIRRILQNLVEEGVPIRDLPKIFEALRDYSAYSREPEVLTEYVRHALARVIGSLYHCNFVIKAYVLEQNVEQLIAGAIRWDEGAFLDLNPETGEKLLHALNKKFRGSSKKLKSPPVLIVSPEIRRFVKLLMERLAPEIPVLSGNEISAEYRVELLGEISLDNTPQFIKKIFSKFRKKKTESFPGDNLQKTLLILNLLGSAGTQISQYLHHADREALRARGMAAPVPSMGKDKVVEEFLSYIPLEKNVKNVDDLNRLSQEDPAMIAVLLKKNWLDGFLPEDERGLAEPSLNSTGRLETNEKEKAAIFISGAARWVQDEVYRWLSVDELRDLGLGMVQFPFISALGKRKAWDESESTFFKEEGWDPETLSRFLQASLTGKLEEFKKRPFRRSQKLAILLFSLPEKTSGAIGKEVFANLPKAGLQRVLTEMTQWRDQLPSEVRFLVVSDFLSFVSNAKQSDFFFSENLLCAEVERTIHRDLEGVLKVLRSLWFSPKDASFIFQTMAAENPRYFAKLILSYYFLNSKEPPMSSRKKLGFFMKSVQPEFEDQLIREFSEEEKKLIFAEAPSKALREKLLKEFLRAYYSAVNVKGVSFFSQN